MMQKIVFRGRLTELLHRNWELEQKRTGASLVRGGEEAERDPPALAKCFVELPQRMENDVTVLDNDGQCRLDAQTVFDNTCKIANIKITMWNRAASTACRHISRHV
eukprot:1144596-Pelagomonas_calceolata.AAC.1